MTPQSYYWIPVRICGDGYVRLPASSPEEAVEKVESGDYSLDDVIDQSIDHIEVTGAPHTQEVS